MENKYYVYIYFDTRKPGIYQYGDLIFDYEPFYIGKGSGNRINSHLKCTEPRKKYIYNKINKINLITGELPKSIKYQFNLDELTAYKLEGELVTLIGRKNLNKGPLINLIDGGKGPTKRIVSEETKNKFRKSIKEYYKNNINKRKGLKRDKSIGGQISKSSIGKVMSRDSLKKRNNTLNTGSILQYNLKGEFIKEWLIHADAAKSLNIDPRRIFENLKNKKPKPLSNFYWKRRLNNEPIKTKII